MDLTPDIENSKEDNFAPGKVHPDSTPEKVDTTSKWSFMSFLSLIATPGVGLILVVYFLIVIVLIPQLVFVVLISGTPFFLIFEFFKLIAAVHTLLKSLLTFSADARIKLLQQVVNKWTHTLIIFRDGVTSFYSVWGGQVGLIMSTAVITYYTSPFYLFLVIAATSVFSFSLQWLNSQMDPSQEMFCFFIAKTKLSYLNLYYSYLNFKIRGWNPMTAESFNTTNFCFDQKTAISFDTSGSKAEPLHSIIRGQYKKLEEPKVGLTTAGKKMSRAFQAELGIRNRYFMTYGNWPILLKPFLRQEFVCRLIEVSEHYYRVRCYRRVVTRFNTEIGGFHKETFDQYYQCEDDWFVEFANLLGLIVEENFTICRQFKILGLCQSYTLNEIIDCFMQSKKRERREHIDTHKKMTMSLEEGSHAEEGHAKDLEGEPVERLQLFYKYKSDESPIWF